MDGSARLQPNPNAPFPEPESYESENCGPKPERPGDVKIGTVRDPVPVTGLAANFSPMPRIAPPPFGNATTGGAWNDPPSAPGPLRPVDPTAALPGDCSVRSSTSSSTQGVMS